MKLQKGMTLIEVVIAVSLLTLITLMFTSGIMDQISLMKRARALTENTFTTSKSLESELQKLREDPASTGVVAQTFTLFQGDPIGERTVAYYPVELAVNDLQGNLTDKKLYSVIAAEQVPGAEVPEILTCVTNLTKNGLPITEGGTYVNSDYVYVDIDLTYGRPDVLLLTKYQWYVSNLGFPIPYNNVEPDDWAFELKCPQFPDDYYLIPNMSLDELNITSNMAGRHIVCASTPSSLVGKLGISYLSEPKYIYGLPVFTNLLGHWDASLIPGGSMAEELDNWFDITDIKIKANTDGTTKPIVKATEFPKLPGKEKPIIAKSVSFQNLSKMTVVYPFNVGAGANFTMFAVARSIDGMGGGTIISNGSAWAFDLSTFTGVSDNEWNVFAINSNGKRTIGKDANTSGNDDPVGDLVGASGTKLGGNEVEVAELIVYSNVMSSTSSQWKQITKYLGEKYNIGG